MYHINSVVQLNKKYGLITSKEELVKLGFTAAETAAESFESYLDEYLDAYKISENGKYLRMFFSGAPEDMNIGIDTSSYFNLNIRVNEKNLPETEQFLQAMLFELISNDNLNLFLRLCDRKNAGSGYGRMLQVVHSDSRKYGGCIYSDDSSLSEVFNEIIKIIEERMVLIAGKYDSVFDYNNNEKSKLPIIVLSIFYPDGISRSVLEKYEFIRKNAEKGGICFFNITDSRQEEDGFTEEIEVKGNTLLFVNSDEPLSVMYETEEVTDEALEAFCAKKMVSSVAEDYFNLENKTEILEAETCIKVPFAVDEYGNIVDFEVGGRAPAHALLSGSTGSGKSVLLHTIIDSIILHYDPDDVEIWAIDYKAVEFACYVKRRTPHISVIGQDKSEDFSYSLLELINKEYERRKKLFLKEGVTSLEDYRAKGKKLSRILVVIDEFHNLTQAVQNNQQYKTMLENLLSEMRAMGMSFLFSSQTISSGLQGLTEKGRNQIGCRICMKQTSLEEARATLNEAYSSSAVDFNDILEFGTGQAIYKKAEESGFSYNHVRVLFISDKMRESIMDIADNRLPDDYKKRKEVICKDSNRYSITEKPEHSLNKFIAGGEMPVNEEGIYIYPAAPTSLEDEFVLKLDRAPANNLLTVIEDNDLRESVIVYSIMSMLAVPDQKVNVCLVDNSLAFSKSLKTKLDLLKADNLYVYFGAKESFDHIYSLEKLKPVAAGNQIELIYGLQKMSSLIYMLNSENENGTDEEVVKREEVQTARTGLTEVSFSGKSDEEKLDSLRNLRSMIMARREKQENPVETAPIEKEKEIVRKTFKEDEIRSILTKLYEYGPDFGYFTLLVFNNAKQFKQVEDRWLKHFEHRIGGMMSADDSYAVFGTEYFVSKADEQTLVYFAGSSKNVKTMRPYLIAEKEYIDSFVNRIGG